MASRPFIPIIAGPTAVGKTETSLRVAEALNAEIISADSRQVYREFSIGTASPTKEDCARVNHHFVREINIGDSFSAGIFAAQVASRILDIQSRKKSILVSGGSTLYVYALTHGLADIPAVDPQIRETLNVRLQHEGPQVLFSELDQADPTFAATLDPSKSQRIVRGLEVFIGTGKPLSYFHTSSPLSGVPTRLFVLYRPREVLYERINARVDQMMRDGLVEEVRTILEGNPDLTDNAFRTIGYQELIPAIRGEYSEDRAIELIKRNSRRYAKRQLTWYKRYDEAIWINVDESNSYDEILSGIGDENL
ncbi:MAG: tRNA (adenosine(37)-N6)-dimethylallyltransferase MiaA [Rhodothermales bacterium]|nr:tRNA (adenosine(37)-N6)-dimethylallyltransferase MiaA [Rhodothermales bacterium]MDG2017620.1 tRNA (adenosine(37)-N6)-dimethylallyltransferase MiaA [Rhodothermales bacterium]